MVCRAVEEADTPDRLKQLNYIFFSGKGASFATGLAALAQALNTDLDWIREYTRLADLADAWDDRGRPVNRLLTGTDIADARAWLGKQPSGAPEPGQLQRDFIAESDRAEAHRVSEENQRLQAMARVQRRVWRLLIYTAALVAVMIAGAATAFRELAVREVQGFEALAREAFDRGEHDTALRYALAGLPGLGHSPLGYWSTRLEDEIRRSVYANRLAAILGGHAGTISKVLWSKDETRLVTFASGDRAARLWNAQTRELINELPQGAVMHDLQISSDGDRILTTGRETSSAARLWDARNGELIRELTEVTGPDAELLFRPESRLVTLSQEDGIVRLWNTLSGELVKELGNAEERVAHVKSAEGVARLLTWKTGSPVAQTLGCSDGRSCQRVASAERESIRRLLFQR